MLGRLQRWPLPDHWKSSGPGLVPTQPMPHSARWTYAAPHFRDESSARRNTGKTTLNEVAVMSHNVNWPVGPAETLAAEENHVYYYYYYYYGVGRAK